MDDLPNVRFVAVARLVDRVPIAQYSATPSRQLPAKLFHDKLDKVLHSARIGEHTRLTITDREVGSIHYDSDPVCLYLVVCARDYQQRTAFRFLGELRNEFDQTFRTDVAGARHSSLSRSAKQMLAQLCDKYNHARNVDKVASVTLQVEEVKGAMQNNIESVLRNQENIETLLDQSDTMKNEATGFQRSAHRAKDKMWWKNTKWTIAIILLVLIIAAAIIGGIVKATK
ncbi:hypothetical protein BWQ96_01230 [Gracilariopsis chorda]|uniref:Uncharacterized protein n=1 Tax=Gracilariopsis chorda TaxID=448386 RepID=A0A2V3J4P9_9FLOR|nr:hypothetical protein BWQ96_01230 [Gracilariopsis chorda]|eukprot:PXF49092.1 hypothetical protein BWQ96_01230 [Gracilariopsis chorda]